MGWMAGMVERIWLKSESLADTDCSSPETSSATEILNLSVRFSMESALGCEVPFKYPCRVVLGISISAESSA